jgi:GDP/UDP-N,N'-diacetylbacillosamine 2-epimerase (hydrolysing)
MTPTRKICVVTGSRSEYGLLRCVMQCLKADPGLELQIIATGMHLSLEFGLTFREIEKDGFRIDRKVEMLLSSDTTLAMAKSTGFGLGGLAVALDDLSPDIVLVLGDRFEIFAAASAAHLLRIPIAHIHGGEVTEGAIDDALRHAISKLSQLHFTSTETYRNRVIQMGEQPDRVFCFGAPGIDAIASLDLMTREELGKSIGFVLGERFLLVTFHPVTLGSHPSSEEMAELLAALADLPKDVRVLFTMPNADAEGRLLALQIREFVNRYPNRAAAFASLGHLRYLSAMKHCLAVVGNSSSSLIEAPSLGVGIINIGDRQKGRIQAVTVINCAPDRSEISQALARALTPEYQQAAAAVVNPYGRAGASEKIAGVVARYPLANLRRKSFYDMSICGA